MDENIQLTVNGKKVRVDIDPETPLLYLLRNNLQLNGPKYGCGIEQCGSCMVLLDGHAMPSCRIPVSALADVKISTLESFGKAGALHRVQQAVIEEQAAQCGYCLNGVIVCATALLNTNPHPSNEEIRFALQRVLCRCGTHSRMIAAVKRAASSK